MAIKVGSISGIPLRIDYSWFIIFLLIVWTVGYGFMPAQYPNLPSIDYLAIGILAAVMLFVSILLHELAHSIVAKRNGLKIGSITLFLFGGVSAMEEEPNTAGLELKMSAAGPLTSVAIAVISWLAWIASVDLGASVLVQAPLYYTALVNVIVAGFNMIPAYPMDGGRVLHSILWGVNKDMVRSTRIASTVGQGFAILMMMGGIFFLLATGDFFSGFWLILIGWFVWSGAKSELNQTIIHRDLSNMKVADIMTRNVDSVSPEINLVELSTDFMERKHNGFAVMSNGEFIGCVTTADLRRVKREAWGQTQVRQVMTLKEKMITVGENDPAERSLMLMNMNQIGRVFVLDAGRKLSGIVTRTDVIKTIQMKEAIYEGKGASVSALLGLQLAVDQGMLFELEPKAGGTEWRASYNSSEFLLVSERIVQLSGGAQTKQFTFQALQKGKYTIVLSQGVPEPGRAPKGQSVTYTIVVG